MRKSFFFLLIISMVQSAGAQTEVINTTDAVDLENCKDTQTLVSTCLHSRTLPSNPVEMMTGDMQVCKCLSASPLLRSLNVPLSNLSKFKASKKRLFENNARNTGNLALLQATGHTKTQEESDTAVLTLGGQEARSAMLNIASATAPAGAVNGAQIKSFPKVTNAITEIGKIPEENRSWQCVTYQEYSLQRELPTDNAFFQILKTSSSEPAAWNYTTLRARFDRAKDAEKEEIQLKLSFLERNPIFKSIFKAEPSEHMSAALIRSKQNELLSILSKLKPADDSNCFSKPNGCWEEAHTRGRYEDYMGAVGAFIWNNDVLDITSKVMTQDYQKEIERISGLNESSSGLVPTNPQGYFDYLQTAEPEVASKCYGSRTEVSCYSKFNDHCSHLKRIDMRIREGMLLSSEDIATNLREEASLHSLMDPTSNPAFRNFNDRICLQAFSNSEGEKLNFFQYQQRVCTDSNNSLPECSDRKELVRRFLREHNSGGEAGDLNIRAGFGNMLESKEELIEVSEAQVEAANNVHESPRELRERFGGRFPSIAQDGKLVPRPPQMSGGGSSPSPASGASTASPDSDSIGSSSTPVSEGATAPVRTAVAAPVSSAPRERASSSASVDVPASQIPFARQTAPVNSLFQSVVSQSNLQNPQRETSNNISSPEEAAQDPVQTESSSTRSTSGALSAVTAGGTGTVSRPLPTPAVRGSAPAASGGQARVSTGSSGNEETPVSSDVNQNLIKYGLDNQPKPQPTEVRIVQNPAPAEVNVSVRAAELERIKENPNSLSVSDSVFDEIMASPDEEVMVVVEGKDGAQNVILYAKKDGQGGVSFSLDPSSRGRAPASDAAPVRIDVTTVAYDSIVSNVNGYLNKNDPVLLELDKKEKFPVTLQVVSPGKRALIYEVTKDGDDYAFKVKTP